MIPFVTINTTTYPLHELSPNISNVLYIMNIVEKIIPQIIFS